MIRVQWVFDPRGLTRSRCLSIELDPHNTYIPALTRARASDSRGSEVFSADAYITAASSVAVSLIEITDVNQRRIIHKIIEFSCVTL